MNRREFIKGSFSGLMVAIVGTCVPSLVFGCGEKKPKKKIKEGRTELASLRGSGKYKHREYSQGFKIKAAESIKAGHLVAIDIKTGKLVKADSSINTGEQVLLGTDSKLDPLYEKVLLIEEKLRK